MIASRAQPNVAFRYLQGGWLYLRELRRTQWLSADELQALQLRRLRELLRDAAANVPYYQSLFQKLGATVDDFRELSDLSRLPVLEKQQVRENPDQFLNRRFDQSRLIEDHTSGSTGEPLRFFVTVQQKAYEMAYSIRFWRWAGYRTGARIAAFRHYIPRRQTDPLWRHDKRTRTLFFSVYDMKPANLRAYIEEFNRFQPEFVRGYPSSIYIFAQFAASEGLHLHAPRAVLSSSETLSPEMRAVIERVLRCPAYDWWGTNERVVTACQCERRGPLHVNAEGGILELAPSMDNAAESGHRMIGTGLINHAMPLIRYDLGDLAIPGGKPCGCGRGLPCVERILGRVNDTLVTGEQKYIPSVRFYTLFETHAQVRQFQVVQTEPNAVVVRIVPSGKFNGAETNELRGKLVRFLGDAVKIDFELVDQIKPEPSGKIRNVVSLVKR
jgi:phenylacetate-coenzyme A ligase PaaK-like adenylate-forming protein